MEIEAITTAHYSGDFFESVVICNEKVLVTGNGFTAKEAEEDASKQLKEMKRLIFKPLSFKRGEECKTLEK